MILLKNLFRIAPGNICMNLLVIATLLLSGCGGGWVWGWGYSTPASSIDWTWVSGANTINQPGSYGTQGVAAAANVPGARSSAVSWTDANGNLWLFGGSGYDSAGTLGTLNDLWKFDGTHWTWVSGANTVNQSGSYGTQGVAAAANVPGARSSAVSWSNANGNLWLFGGGGYDSAGGRGNLNDLWHFHP